MERATPNVPFPNHVPIASVEGMGRGTDVRDLLPREALSSLAFSRQNRAPDGAPLAFLLAGEP